MGNAIALERVVAGCGIDFVEVVDPYDLKAMRTLLKKAAEYVSDPEGGIAVIISRHPCLINDRDGAVPTKIPVVVNDKCDLCGFCHDRFECPALYKDREREQTRVNPILCAQCGVCLQVCPKDAIEAV